MRKIINTWENGGRIKGITIWLCNYSNEFLIEYYYNENYNEITRTRYTTKIYDRTHIPVKEAI